MNLFFVVFRSFVLLPNSMSKLIHNRCTCKLIIKTTVAYVHAHEQLRPCFYVLVRYPVVLPELFSSENYTKTIIRLGPLVEHR